VPGSLADYVRSPYFSQTRSFYAFDWRTPQVLNRLSIDRGQIISATIAPGVQRSLNIINASPSHDGKNWAFRLENGGGGVSITYLGVYTADGKLHVLVAPTSVDTDSHLLTYTTPPHYAGASPDYGVDSPLIWSPHDRYILFDMVTEDSIHYVSTDCLTDSQKPCVIHTVRLKDPATQYFGWSDVIWTPDGTHLLFSCYASTLPTPEANVPTLNSFQIQIALQDLSTITSDICLSALDGSDFRHLHVPHLQVEPYSLPIILTAISPDGRILAYAQTSTFSSNAPFDQWIYFYDLTSGRVIDQIHVGSQGITVNLAWLPLDVVHRLDSLPSDTPTPTPSITPTPSMTLSLSPFCIPGRQLWGWNVFNPNSVAVFYTVTWTDADTGKLMTQGGIAEPAQNGVPTANQQYGTFTQAGSNVVRLYVSGVLQVEQQSPSIACTKATLTPTASNTAVPFR